MNVNTKTQKESVAEDQSESSQFSRESAKNIIFYSSVLDRHQNTLDVKINLYKIQRLVIFLWL